MGKTVYFAAATLDGFVADDDDGISWLTGFESDYDGPGEPVLKAIDAFIEGVGAIVMGSATYGFLRDNDHWPYGDRPSWVLTSRDLPAIEDADIRFHDGPITDVHPEMLKAAGDRDLWVMGGGPVASQFAAVGLLDELHVTIVPIVLGSGKPLFSSPIDKGMTLLATHQFANGLFELRYALAK